MRAPRWLRRRLVLLKIWWAELYERAEAFHYTLDMLSAEEQLLLTEEERKEYGKCRLARHERAYQRDL